MPFSQQHPQQCCVRIKSIAVCHTFLNPADEAVFMVPLTATSATSMGAYWRSSAGDRPFHQLQQTARHIMHTGFFQILLRNYIAKPKSFNQ